uniref:Uncharacterized protein n=1 Tax=Glossina austeni TaxID=7395 RepID=A0A1A9VAM3_GLOAU
MIICERFVLYIQHSLQRLLLLNFTFALLFLISTAASYAGNALHICVGTVAMQKRIRTDCGLILVPSISQIIISNVMVVIHCSHAHGYAQPNLQIALPRDLLESMLP